MMICVSVYEKYNQQCNHSIANCNSLLLDIFSRLRSLFDGKQENKIRLTIGLLDCVLTIWAKVHRLSRSSVSEWWIGKHRHFVWSHKMCEKFFATDFYYSKHFIGIYVFLRYLWDWMDARWSNVCVCACVYSLVRYFMKRRTRDVEWQQQKKWF